MEHDWYWDNAILQRWADFLTTQKSMLPVQQQLEVTTVTFKFQDNKIQLQQAVEQQEAKSESTYGRDDLCLRATQSQNPHFFFFLNFHTNGFEEVA